MSVHEKLMKVQTEIKAPKNLYNSFGKYSYRNAESICEAAKPFLVREKATLVLEDEIETHEGANYIKATAIFTDAETGDSIRVSARAREEKDLKGMTAPQITGATSSYARKYALNGLFLLDDTKDADTDEFHNQTQEKPQPQSKPAQSSPAGNMASEKQLNMIKAICGQHGIQYESLCKGNNIDSTKVTKAQANNMIKALQSKYGESK